VKNTLTSAPSEARGSEDSQHIRLLAAIVVDGKSLVDGAVLLDRLGVSRATTAAIYDTTQGTIRSTIAKAKTKKKNG
jgi:hypothetical protein